MEKGTIESTIMEATEESEHALEFQSFSAKSNTSLIFGAFSSKGFFAAPCYQLTVMSGMIYAAD